MTKKLLRIFKKLKIPYNFSKKLIYYNDFISKYSNELQYLNGGGKNDNDIEIKKEKIKFKDYTFIVLSYYEDKDYIIKLETKDKINCFLIILSSFVDYAYINNISNYKDCSCEGNLPSNGGGKILLKFVINYLIQNKKTFKFKINKIVLQDNSYITCNKINIPLSDLYFLTKGNTWYGQFNFRPFDSLNNIPDKNNTKIYENCKNKLEQIKLKDYIKIYDLIIKADKKLNINHIDENKFKKIIIKNENMLLKDFLNKLLKEKIPMCLIFNEIKSKIMSDLNIKSFHTNSFYLQI